MFVRFSAIILIFSCQLFESEPSSVPSDDYINILTAVASLKEMENSECTKQLVSLTNALANGTQWALKMVDAAAKFQGGLLTGNIMHIGNYDECLEIDEYFYGERIQGKYCTAFFQPHPQYGQALKELFLNLAKTVAKKDEIDLSVATSFTYGLCVPTICTTTDLQNLADTLVNENHLPLQFQFVDDFCATTDGQPFTTSAIVAIVVFSVFAVLVACSTVYEFLFSMQLKETEERPDLFVAFSVISNGKKLLSTSTAKENLNCLNGIRVISLMWILQGHTLQYLYVSPLINTAGLGKWRSATESAFYVACDVGVDTFFIISGLLVVYLFMKSQAKGIKFSLPMFYLHRILRLTPSLAMVVLLMTTLIKYMGNGPLWPIVYETFQKPCEKKWWLTLLYSQNYINIDDQCLAHAWYISVDTQMYFLSPIILFPLIKWPKQTIGASLVFIILNCSYVFEITWKRRFGSTFFNGSPAQYKYLYGPTHIRGCAYLIGMICGYFIYKTKTSRPLKLQRVMVMILWVFSLLVMIGVILAFSVVIGASEYNVVNASIFNSLIRVGWSVGVSIVILLCVNGYGGFINSFLSSKIFTVLIRLNYSVYLLHEVVIALILAQGRTPIYFSNMLNLHNCMGNYMFSIGAAFIWALAFESPVLAIEKNIFGGIRRKPIGGLKTDNIVESVGSVQICNNVDTAGPSARQTEQ